MDYKVLSRKYRPDLFSKVIGQDSIVKILTNILGSKKIPHAFLFTGIRGTGKTTTARILAKALNCRSSSEPVAEPCNECDSCRQLSDGRSMDVMEVDGASNTSVNDVRQLKENTRFLPSQLRYKIYIIDEVHMLSTEAFNALLKTLEEPPPYVVFILATTEAQKIPETVLSRCIRLNFRRVEPREIVRYLSGVLKDEGIEFEENALFLIARQSEGSVRDSLSFLELVLAYGEGKLREKDVVEVLGLLSRSKVFDMLGYLAVKDAVSILKLLHEVRAAGGDLHAFVENMVFYMRYLVMGRLGLDLEDSEFSTEEREILGKLAGAFEGEELVVYYQALRQLMEQLRFSSNPQYDVEIGMLKLVLLKDFLDIAPGFGGKRNAASATGASAVAVSAPAPDKQSRTASAPPVSSPADSPAPSPKAVPAARDAGGFVSLISTKMPFLGPTFTGSKVEYTGDTVAIAVPHDHRITYEHLMHDDKERKEIEKLAVSFFGRMVTVTFRVDDEGTDAGQPASLRDVVMENPKIAMLLTQIPGAKILDIRRVERKSGNDEPAEDAEVERKEDTDE